MSDTGDVNTPQMLTSAVSIIAPIFAERGVGAKQPSPASPELLPLDKASEGRRVKTVAETVGSASPGLVEDTGALLFRDLWLRPDLARRRVFRAE